MAAPNQTSAHGGAVATQNKRVIDCTSREQRAINRSKKRGDTDRWQRASNRSKKRGDSDYSSIATGITTSRRIRRRISVADRWLAKVITDNEKYDAAAAFREEKFGCHDLPERCVPDTPYQEKPFGDFFACDGKYGSLIAGAAPRLLDHVVSLALFDGDDMLFACSGVALPRGAARQHLTRFLTSARLVAEFHKNRNRDDKLGVKVRLPDNRTANGFLGLYDDDIAIVTSFSLLRVRPIHLDRVSPNPFSLSTTIAFGRAFNSGRLMVEEFSLLDKDPTVDDVAPRKFINPGFSEAALGGLLIDVYGNFLGVIHHHDQNWMTTWYLPQKSLCQRLEQFGILTQEGKGDDEDEDEDEDEDGSSRGTRKRKRGYSLPPGVKRIDPSGFMRVINWLKFEGYPMPPPLVLEGNGVLRNSFREDFGEVRAWNGTNFHFRSRQCFWYTLPEKVFTNISRRAVSVASFNGSKKFFTCTGLLISWHARMRIHTCMGTRTRTRSVILTSASLVRTRDDDDEIDRNLRIEVFLPPHQCADGTLELYHSNYNIAIISVDKHFLAARPENIFSTVQKPSKKVLAIGREAVQGLLLASMGEVTDSPRDEPSEIVCEDLKLSTCKIKKVGIGGPLINSDDGSFVGMNFYDDTDKTPFLPRCKIVDVLKRIDLPSERGLTRPVNMMDGAAVTKNRWPVPEAYWYHPLFDENLRLIRPPVGRILQ